MILPRKLPDEVEQFIAAHAHADTVALALRYREIAGVPIATVVDQIAGRRKARVKLPTWHSHPGVLYPPAINLEQCSSETTARFKAALLSDNTETTDAIVDLTGGFGVDTFFFSKKFNSAIHVEPDAALQQVGQHNHLQLGAGNLSYVNEDADAFLRSVASVYSAIFIDPSRRKESRKVYSFSDCDPDVTQLQDSILAIAPVLLVKASPMHDIQRALVELHHVKKVVVVAVDNEVRELLFLITRDFNGAPLLSAVNIADGHTVAFDFHAEEEQQAEAVISTEAAYLYEPYAAILKAGAFKLVAQRYGVRKLHANTHLYTSDECVRDFPGRIFRVTSAVKADRRSVAEVVPEGQANIITRNYPATPDELRKKLKLRDGGDRYVLAFTSPKGPTVVVAERLK